MLGLVYRDLLIFFRKNSKVTYIMEFVYFLFFLLVLRNIYGAITYLVVAAPLNMCGLPTILKEIDTNYKGMMSARLLPYRKIDIVRGRFLAAFSCHIIYLTEMLIFCILHYFICGNIPAKTYILLFFAGWLMAIFITSINLLSSFLSSFNAVAIIYMMTLLVLVGLYLLFMLTGLQDIILSLVKNLGAGFMWGVTIMVTILTLLISYVLSVKRFERS